MGLAAGQVADVSGGFDILFSLLLALL